jgi:uncharacterized protein involved in high-affinity Fe2+ transport
MSAHETKETVNHDEIKEWVEKRDGFPATVEGTGTDDEPGILRISYPDYSDEQNLKRISWEAFFKKFDEENLAFLYQEQLASGETSRFSRFIGREGADLSQSDGDSRRKRESTSKTTTAKKPPMEATEEATEDELKLARSQGEAFHKAVNAMTEKDDTQGEEKAAGHFVIGYVVEKAEGMYKMQNGKLQWTEPEDENVHLEVVVRDGADGRFIPHLVVYMTVIDADGNELGTHRQPFLWHPWLYHYGRNWQLPGDGQYTLHIHVEAPAFGRHDEENGKRYMEAVQATFDHVEIETGQK